MPELPEVETIRRDLSRLLVGKTIARVEVREFKMVSPRNLAEKLKKLKINKLGRRAKLLIFELSDGNYLMIHLKLTGQLVFRGGKDGSAAVGGHPIKHDLQTLPNKFSRVIFTFTDGSRLFFNDVRKFGYLRIVDGAEWKKIDAAYGLEPLSRNFTLENFKRILQKRPRLKIKQLLMEQTLLAGLGNIYSDEACYQAGVRPSKTAGALKETESKKLFQAIAGVLKKSLTERGTSVDNYVDAFGRAGGFVPYLMVYGRAGEKCKRCRASLATLKIGGRTSNFCPRCQH